MVHPNRGEVWLVDLGLAARTRPCVVLSVLATGPNDHVLVTLVRHTTSPRDSQFKVALSVRFLKAGAFDAQNLVTVPHAKLVRKLGVLSAEPLAEVEAAVRRWLDLMGAIPAAAILAIARGDVRELRARTGTGAWVGMSRTPDGCGGVTSATTWQPEASPDKRPEARSRVTDPRSTL